MRTVRGRLEALEKAQAEQDAHIGAVMDEVMGILSDEDLEVLADFPAEDLPPDLASFNRLMAADPTGLPAFSRFMGALCERLSTAEMMRMYALIRMADETT